jgi:hypothetical protein
MMTANSCSNRPDGIELISYFFFRYEGRHTVQVGRMGYYFEAKFPSRNHPVNLSGDN